MAELRRYALVSAYLYVCFGAILLYKSAILSEAGQHYLPFGVAAVKALILGKFVLIGRWRGWLAPRIGGIPARWPAIAVSAPGAGRADAVEEFVVAMIHGRTAGERRASSPRCCDRRCSHQRC